MSHISGRWWRWKFWNILSLALVLICLYRPGVRGPTNTAFAPLTLRGLRPTAIAIFRPPLPFAVPVSSCSCAPPPHSLDSVAMSDVSCFGSAALGCQVDCNQMLTAQAGSFTSPCYPSDYPKNQACRWTLQAPAGFIVQITFLDFELEEALRCIYDRLVVSTGSTNVTFCGITANGLTLNSTGNVMDVSFSSDFSVQKRGFDISYRQVAVALRNQKVIIPQNAGKSVKVSEHFKIPALTQFTVCFEIARTSQKKEETIFTYSDKNTAILSLGLSANGVMTLSIYPVDCSLSSILTQSDFTSAMAPLCIAWSNLYGTVNLFFDRNYRTTSCTSSKGLSVKSDGTFQIGGKSSFDGLIYNFRMWDFAMSEHEFEGLVCDTVGNIIDWDNTFWDIPAAYAQTDSTLRCSTSIPPVSTVCPSPGLGCPDTSIQNTTGQVTSNNIPLTISMPTEVHPTAMSSSTTVPLTEAPNTPPSNPSTAMFSQAATDSETTTVSGPTAPNTVTFNSLTKETLAYRITFYVTDSQEKLTKEEVAGMVRPWLAHAFQNWTYDVNVSSSIQPQQAADKSYHFQALLLFRPTSDTIYPEAMIKSKLVDSNQTLGDVLTLKAVTVQILENCPAEENPLHYSWPETQPLVNQSVPCFPNKDQSAYRKCLVNDQNYTSYWGQPDTENCTNIEDIEVSAENAAEVATTLAGMTYSNLSTKEVSTVMTKLKEIVNVAKINESLANTMVTVFSNVMTTSDSTLAASSEMVLKTVEELILKIEFTGPTVSIISENLALGISAFNSSSFNGTSFSAYRSPNSTDLQIDFQSYQQNSLASVTLPPTLFNNLSLAETDIVSRINFMFFSKTGLFQIQNSNGPFLSSYVVASSVGNQSINNLQDPVHIEIAHLQDQDQKPICVFWDFTKNNGTGGWNTQGCSARPNGNRTVCLCNHLTHFGILMDISNATPSIDEQNTKILTFITNIGCGISVIFLAATLLTYIAFEKLRRDYPSKILMNLSTSLLLLNMVFLLDGWVASLDSPNQCIPVAALLHYFLLTTFTWMGLESVHMYIALVKVFNTYIRRYILKFCIVGWGVPLIVVLVVIAVNKDSYGLPTYGNDTSQFCWLNDKKVFYVTCVGYFSIIFLMNMAMFIVVMNQICGRNGKRRNRTRREEMLRNLRSVVSLTFLLGMTWGFAFFAWGPVSLIFMYLFSIFNSLQGLFIFIFHCALKENVQKQWRRYLCCGQFRLPDNSDWSKTATNNTKKVSSDNLGKSFSSCSFGSTTANWTSKAKATLNPFVKSSSSSGKGFSSQGNAKLGPPEADGSSIIPVHQVIDKVKGYCSVHSDNFYKNIIMSDSFSSSTKF